jgi:uncharacterized protein YqjF (DUF2071 family)
MQLREIHGIIRRRMLVNYRVEPEIVHRLLPSKFRPKLHDGFAVAGICLIRLEQMRLRQVPSFLGMSSENAAHRIAVLWDDEQGRVREGVFVARRDTNSTMNTIAGGWLFPGEYHKANFRVTDSVASINFEMKSRDGEVAVRLRSKASTEFPANSKFANLKMASDFFEPGSLGYSVTRDRRRMNGMTLHTKTWRVEPLYVEELYSS